MDDRTAKWLLRWDIDWWSWCIPLTVVGLIDAMIYQHGPKVMAYMTIHMLLPLVAVARPGFLSRWCCKRWAPRLLPEEMLKLRVAATLQEFPAGRIFPRRTAGWLYLTTERLVFHSRKRTIDIPFDSIRGLSSQPPGGWWQGLYVNMRRIHVRTDDATVTIGVRYPHITRNEIERQILERKGRNSL